MSLIVLIVDDDNAVRFFHEIIVSQSKLSVAPLSFATCEEAFDYLNENCNTTDTYLILLDINLPVMNGWDFLEAIRDKSYYKQVYFVIVTSSVDRADKEKATLYSRIIEVVEKPITDEACKRIMNYPSITHYF